MFELDTGSSGVGGPFLQWSARGTQDGSVPARSFYIRDGSDKKPYDGSKGHGLGYRQDEDRLAKVGRHRRRSA
jgi:hypothetical protein